MSSVCVGNDVVDLDQPRTVGRSADERFLRRVFDEEEQAAVCRAADQDLELWTRWAAKEAGFKAISKLIGEPPPFVHRAFKVEWHAPGEGHARLGDAVIRRGFVRWRDHMARVFVAFRPGRVHAVASIVSERPEAVARVCPRVALLDAPQSPWSGSLEELLPRFSEREAEAVHSRASAAARVGARGDLAALLGVSEDRLEIVCAPGGVGRTPPRVLLDGREAEADVSLSHDGRWVAWAIWDGHLEGVS